MNMKTAIKSLLNYLNTNKLWFYILLALLLKSFILLGLMADDNTKFNFFKGFYLLSIFSLPYYVVFIALFLSYAFLFKNPLQSWFLLLLDLSISLLLMTDLWYYRGGYGTFLNVHLLKETANLENLWECVFSFIHFWDFILLLDIPIFFKLIYQKKYRVNAEKGRNYLLFFFIFIISVMYIAYVPIKYYVFGKNDPRMELLKICWSPNQTISNLSPLGFHIFDAYNYWKECQPLLLDPEENKTIQDWFQDKKEVLPDNEYKGLFAGKNLILIQVESLETFVVGKKVNGQEITPNLNKLLPESLYFSNIYEQVFNGTSSDCDLMVNTSVFPVRNGSTFFRFPNTTYNSFPKLLQKKGYHTLAIHPDKGAYWNWMEALYAIGFNNCLDASSFAMDELIGLGLSDGSFLRQVTPRMQSLPQPFYTFMVTLTNHGPFKLPEKYRELELDENLDKTKLGGYFQSVHYTDKQLGFFLAYLGETGLLENTVVVIIGDHGGIHKFYNDEVKKMQPSEDWWQEEYNRVPMLVYSKGLNGKEISTLGGQIDIMPTLSYLMGIEEKEYENTVMGRNLLKTAKNFVVLCFGDFLGNAENEEEKKKAITGLIEIGDKIIRSNYFLSH